jgi:DNA-binding CsgD family transcriptional regulator
MAQVRLRGHTRFLVFSLLRGSRYDGPMRRERSTERARQDIIRLCHAGLDSWTLLRGVLDRFRKAVPVDAYWCATADPATLLFTGSIKDEIPEQATPYFLTNEFLQDDVNKFASLARGSRSVDALYEVTGEAPTSSPRYRDILEPMGFGDELRGALIVGRACWGFLCLHRELSSRGFTADEAALLRQVTPHLGEGIRASLLIDHLDSAPESAGPGLLLLTDTLELAALTPIGERWLAEIDDWAQTGELPPSILALAVRLQALERDGDVSPDFMPRARVRTRSGVWLVTHASRVTGVGPPAQIAIIFELARPLEVAPLVLQAYDVTARETEVAELVLRGLSTGAIAADLCISALTVQQHLKAVFEKVGVHSRRELSAQVFAQQYRPRMLAGDRLGVTGWFEPTPPGS